MAAQSLGVCHVYLWKATDFGHIALDPVGGPYISFWPRERHKGLQSVPAKWFSSFQEEIEKYGIPDETYHIMDMNINEIRTWWESFTESDPEWSLLVQSCSNVVYKALCKGNEAFKGRVEGFITTPGSVAELVRYHTENQKATIRLGSFCTPSSK